MVNSNSGSAVADPTIRLTGEQEHRLDQEARGLLADPKLGRLVREACGAARCGRRERGRALHTLDALLKPAFGEPVIAEILVRAIAMAWRDRMLAIHHEGAGDKDRMRGFTALDAASVATLHVKRANELACTFTVKETDSDTPPQGASSIPSLSRCGSVGIARVTAPATRSGLSGGRTAG
jgi:hypothetical protein